MKAIENKVVAAFAFVFVAAAAPVAAQNPAQINATCDPTANTRGDIAKAQFSMTRAISFVYK